MTAPFFQHEGHWYVRPYERRLTPRQLTATLHTLQQHHPPHDILLLRRMSPAEVRLLDEHRMDCDAEILSMILAPEEAR